MNYRHHFHAGNFADVVKHALLVQLVRSLQKKDKGFLYLDTHAGRGGYDLAASAQGDSLVRKAEHLEGIGRLWKAPDLSPELADYLALVREYDRLTAGTGAPGDLPAGPRYYPGSPWLVHALARGQDRLVLCERQPEECTVLDATLGFFPRTQVRAMDGYEAVRALLPPPERRALVLIDPPFESQNEFADMASALREGLRRFPSGVFAGWYPLTERARVNAFFDALLTGQLPPTLVAEVTIAGDTSGLKMKGCGLVILNPPWHFDRLIAPMLGTLAERLAQAPGGAGVVSWLVPER